MASFIHPTLEAFDVVLKLVLANLKPFGRQLIDRDIVRRGRLCADEQEAVNACELAIDSRLEVVAIIDHRALECIGVGALCGL